jgi:hypothetical protein
MRTVLGTLALLLALTACSSSDDEPNAAPTTPAATPTSTAPAPTPTESSTSFADDQLELREAVQAYSDAFLTGDADAAYALLSKRCQDRTGKAEFAAIVEQAGQQYGDPLPFKTFSTGVLVDDADLARVTYTYAVAEINQDAEPWVREDGAWHEDDC